MPGSYLTKVIGPLGGLVPGCVKCREPYPGHRSWCSANIQRGGGFPSHGSDRVCKCCGYHVCKIQAIRDAIKKQVAECPACEAGIPAHWRKSNVFVGYERKDFRAAVRVYAGASGDEWVAGISPRCATPPSSYIEINRELAGKFSGFKPGDRWFVSAEAAISAVDAYLTRPSERFTRTNSYGLDEWWEAIPFPDPNFRHCTYCTSFRCHSKRRVALWRGLDGKGLCAECMEILKDTAAFHGPVRRDLSSKIFGSPTSTGDLWQPYQHGFERKDKSGAVWEDRNAGREGVWCAGRPTGDVSPSYTTHGTPFVGRKFQSSTEAMAAFEEWYSVIIKTCSEPIRLP